MDFRSIAWLAPVLVMLSSAARAEDLSGRLGRPAGAEASVARHEPSSKKAHLPPARSRDSRARTAPSLPANSLPAERRAAALPAPVPQKPAGATTGPSLDFKWRATNDRINPYSAVNHAVGPNGQGDTFEGGVKFGF